MSLPHLFERIAADPVVASLISFTGTTAIAAQVPGPEPADPVGIIVRYGPTIIGPALIFVAARVIAGRKAKKKSLAATQAQRAAERRARAERMLADANPANDGDAQRLHAEADALEDEADDALAAAAELEAISKPHAMPDDDDDRRARDRVRDLDKTRGEK